MNWNSIMRSVAAFAMYVALVAAYLVGISPLGFALCVAIILGIGLWAHSVDFYAPQHRSASNQVDASSLLPSFSDSMTQLHLLQAEINELQAQFALDTESRSEFTTPRGSAN